MRDLKAGDFLEVGDEITTNKLSHAAIQIGDDIIVKIDRETTVSVSRLSEGKEHEVFLKSGKVFSKIKRLQPGFEYRVKTPSITASVRGTEFSVSADTKIQKIAVADGIVMVTRKATAGIKEIQRNATAGKTLIITDSVKEKPISDIEKLEIEKVSIVPFMKDIESLKGDTYERAINKHNEKHNEIDKKIHRKKVPRSLNEVKHKFGRVDEISLYNGKIYRGVILKRGTSYKILTTAGTINVPKSKIKSTRVIR